MGGKFDRSMQLFRASWGVLREDMALVLYPVISAITGLVIIATFAIPIFAFFIHWGTESVLSPTTNLYVDRSTAHMDPAGWLLLGIGYFVLIYVGIFCNAALIYAANERLTGTGPGTLGSGFRGASKKAGAFVPWALLSATVTLVLRSIEERMGLIGRIVISMVGIAWTLVTYLVVPILVLEDDHSTGKAISRSAKLFKGTWGENVIGNAGFGIFNLIVVVMAGALFILGLMSGSVVGIVMAGLLAVVLVLVATELIAAMSGIYRVALYRYAVDGRPPAAFVAYDFVNAFRPKSTSGLFSSTRARTIYRSSPGMSQADQQREAWKPWEPPAEERIDGEFGIEIPGMQALSDQDGMPPTAPPPASHMPDEHGRVAEGNPWDNDLGGF